MDSNKNIPSRLPKDIRYVQLTELYRVTGMLIDSFVNKAVEGLEALNSVHTPSKENSDLHTA